MNNSRTEIPGLMSVAIESRRPTVKFTDRTIGYGDNLNVEMNARW